MKQGIQTQRRKAPIIPFFLFFLCSFLMGIPMKKYAEPAVKDFIYDQVSRNLVSQDNPLQNKNFFWGAYASDMPYSLKGFYELEDSLDNDLQIVSFYQAWGDGKEHEFPTRILKNISKAGKMPMITWEPWLSAFERNEKNLYGSGFVPYSLQQINQGQYDSYIREWARGATRFGMPLLLRPAHEMSNPRYPWSQINGNTEHDFQWFWKHLVRIFREEGAFNVQFVWTPYQLEDHKFFPGKEWVDYVGLDIFNYGESIENGNWTEFEALLEYYYSRYRKLDIPIFISELGSAEVGGNKEDWYLKMFKLLHSERVQKQYPLLKGLVFFENRLGDNGHGIPIDWSLSSMKNVFSKID
jgi:hypothetical protein